MTNSRIEWQVLTETRGLRIAHRQPGDWGGAFFVMLLIFLPAWGTAIAAWPKDDASAPWAMAGSLLVFGVGVLILARDSRGLVSVGEGEFSVEGRGAVRVGGDRMRWEEVEALEWTSKTDPVPGDDETVLPGLHAVRGEWRICLMPQVSPAEARRVLEEILRVAPVLRGKVRWESWNEVL